MPTEPAHDRQVSDPRDELRIGQDPVVEAYKAHVDRSLLRENLRRSVEERLENLMRMQRFAAELRAAAKHAR